jgi:hypothetical protein
MSGSLLHSRAAGELRRAVHARHRPIGYGSWAAVPDSGRLSRNSACSLSRLSSQMCENSRLGSPLAARHMRCSMRRPSWSHSRSKSSSVQGWMFEVAYQGSGWQRCRVLFLRNALAQAGKSGRRVVSPFIATAFAQDQTDAAKAQWRQVADQVRTKLPKLAALLDEANEDVLADLAFPKEHRAKIHSTSPLERLNGEVKRRTEVGRHLPERGRQHPSGRGDPARAQRRMVGAAGPIHDPGNDRALAQPDLPIVGPAARRRYRSQRRSCASRAVHARPWAARHCADRPATSLSS